MKTDDWEKIIDDCAEKSAVIFMNQARDDIAKLFGADAGPDLLVFYLRSAKAAFERRIASLTRR